MNKCVTVAFCLLIAGLARADEAQGWRFLADGLFEDARVAFAAVSAKGADEGNRGARLGEALSWLQLQPRTDARVRRGVALLDELLAENTADEVGVRARYFRARAEHVHRLSPSPAAATEHYERLVAEHPAHALAGQAVVKLALIRLYAPEASEAERLQTRREFAARAETLGDAAARRDLHLVLGEAALRLDLGTSEALEHFTAALSAGVASRPVRADTLVRAGELARELGRVEVAREHYARFAAEFPRDPRRRLVLERLAALDEEDAR